MNQIKQKIKEIGLSQREISKRLGKNPSYLAGVFRSGLSTAKQAELMEQLDIVGDGGTVQSDDQIIAELSQILADYQDNTDTLIKRLSKIQRNPVSLSIKYSEQTKNVSRSKANTDLC